MKSIIYISRFIIFFLISTYSLYPNQVYEITSSETYYKGDYFGYDEEYLLYIQKYKYDDKGLLIYKSEKENIIDGLYYEYLYIYNKENLLEKCLIYNQDKIIATFKFKYFDDAVKDILNQNKKYTGYIRAEVSKEMEENEFSDYTIKLSYDSFEIDYNRYEENYAIINYFKPFYIDSKLTFIVNNKKEDSYKKHLIYDDGILKNSIDIASYHTLFYPGFPARTIYSSKLIPSNNKENYSQFIKSMFFDFIIEGI